MIYEGQAKRRMAKILEPRECRCAQCCHKRELASIQNMRIDNARISNVRRELPSIKRKEG